jgi:hypothetical protein
MNKQMYGHLAINKRMEKAAMINSVFLEIHKIAEEAKKVETKEPPKWLNDAADIAGFIGGAAAGSYAGDIVGQKLLRIKNPKAQNFAKYVGAGLAGYATMKILPELKKRAPESLKDIIGKE